MISRLLHQVTGRLDSMRFEFKKALKLFDPIIIYPYRSYGYKDRVIMRGRVLEREGVVHTEETKNTLFHNLYRFYKRYESDEIPYAKLQIRYKDQTYDTSTDDEGFYYLEISTEGLPDAFTFDDYEIRLTDDPTRQKTDAPVTARGEIVRPGPDCEIGIISDVDDTILESHAAKWWRHIKIQAVEHTDSRVAFAGVTSLYHGLVNAPDEAAPQNPLWFVSGSAWNLYDMLERFRADKNIPKAPFLLRQLGLEPNWSIKQDTVEYKLGQIEPILKLTDPLPFILIGDSGQKDPEIYYRVAKAFPGRISAVYIRDVIASGRDKEVQAVSEKMARLGVPMILAEDSLPIAHHAHDNGWISSAALERVKEELRSRSSDNEVEEVASAG